MCPWGTSSWPTLTACRRVGAPRQLCAAPWPGAEDSSASSRSPRRRQPPSLLCHGVLLCPPRLMGHAWRRQGLRAPLRARRAAAAAVQGAGRSLRRTGAPSSCKFPLPAARGRAPGLAPAPRRAASTSSVTGCAFFLPSALLASHSLACLACRLSHPPQAPRQRNAWKSKGRSDGSPERFLRGEGRRCEDSASLV